MGNSCAGVRATVLAGIRPGSVGAYIPSCKPDGTYKTTQCHGSTGFCWCVNSKGKEIKGTKTGPGQARINCGENLRCKGIDNGCCTKDNPCEKGDGDCDGDEECAGDLTCGRDNCPFGDADDDCCIGEKFANKCKVNNGGCSHKCASVFGAVKCTCPKGFALGSDKKTCSEVNECRTGAHKCHANAVCTNTIGSYKCSCKAGYQGNGLSCTDVNECSKGRGGCSHTCVNTIGGFRCTCPSGYTLSGNKRTCSDINECNRGRGGCSHTCVNTNGGFHCRCPNGWKLSGNRRTCQRNQCRSSCRVEVFEHRGYGGRRVVYDHNIPQVRHNDQMSSFKVGGGCCVTFYEHGGFGGKSRRECHNRDWVGNWWNDKMSSLRVSGGRSNCGGGGGGGCSVEVFENRGYGGRRTVYNRETRQVRPNDQMSSFKVKGGCCVTFYEHGGFGGRSRRECGNKDWVGNWWNDKMSSPKFTEEGEHRSRNM